MLWQWIQLSVRLWVVVLAETWWAIRDFCTSVDTYSKSLLSTMKGVKSNQSVRRCLAGTLQNTLWRCRHRPVSITDWALSSEQPDLSGCKRIPVEPMYSLACIWLIMATVCISTEQPLIWLGKGARSNSLRVFIESHALITYGVPLTGTLYCFESSLNGSLKHCNL